MVSLVARVIRGGWRAVVFSVRTGRALVGYAWPTGAILAILFGIGVLAAWLRLEIIAISPWIADHSKLVAGIWNVWAKSVQVVIDAVQIVAYGVKVVSTAVKDLFENKAYENPSPPHLVRFTKVSPDDVQRTFNQIPIECTPYSGPWSIIRGILRRTVGHDTCRLLRTFQPTDLDPVLSGLIGFASNGDYVPQPYGDNCDAPQPPMPWFCVPFGAGYLILELLLPILMGTILLLAAWSAWKADRADQADYTADARLDVLEKKPKML